METAEEVGRRLDIARERAGNPSFTMIERAVVLALGMDAPTGETIRAYHRGQGPKPANMNLELIEALADFYGCTIYEISVTVGDRLSRLLLRNSGDQNSATGSTVTPRLSRKRAVPALA